MNAALHGIFVVPSSPKGRSELNGLPFKFFIHAHHIDLLIGFLLFAMYRESVRQLRQCANAH
ncbi:hypothetical protein PSP6_10142 [Paraburkholderia tropica]|nr:hypothetical protein PSP6_10142 [Paraburkholderia tropica]